MKWRNDYSDKVNAIVDFYGPTDITKMNEAPTTADYTVPDSPVGILIGKLDVVTKHEEKAQKANVLNYITKGRDIPPIIIFHGAKTESFRLNRVRFCMKNCWRKIRKVQFIK